MKKIDLLQVLESLVILYPIIIIVELIVRIKRDRLPLFKAWRRLSYNRDKWIYHYNREDRKPWRWVKYMMN